MHYVIYKITSFHDDGKTSLCASSTNCKMGNLSSE